MQSKIDRVLEVAHKRLTERWGIRDPQLVADVLSRLWYRIAIQGIKPGKSVLWYCLKEERAQKPFPGCGTRIGRQDMLTRATVRIEDIVGSKRYLDPAYAAQLGEEVSLVRQECRKRSEAIVVNMLWLGQTLMEASRESGLHYVTIAVAKPVFIARCRAKRKARARR